MPLLRSLTHPLPQALAVSLTDVPRPLPLSAALCTQALVVPRPPPPPTHRCPSLLLRSMQPSPAAPLPSSAHHQRPRARALYHSLPGPLSLVPWSSFPSALPTSPSAPPPPCAHPPRSLLHSFAVFLWRGGHCTQQKLSVIQHDGHQKCVVGNKTLSPTVDEHCTKKSATNRGQLAVN